MSPARPGALTAHAPGKSSAAPPRAALWECAACLAPVWFVGAAVTKGARGLRRCQVEVLCGACGLRDTFTAAAWWLGQAGLDQGEA